MIDLSVVELIYKSIFQTMIILLWDGNLADVMKMSRRKEITSSLSLSSIDSPSCGCQKAQMIYWDLSIVLFVHIVYDNHDLIHLELLKSFRPFDNTVNSNAYFQLCDIGTIYQPC